MRKINLYEIRSRRSALADLLAIYDDHESLCGEVERLQCLVNVARELLIDAFCTTQKEPRATMWKHKYDAFMVKSE